MLHRLLTGRARHSGYDTVELTDLAGRPRSTDRFRRPNSPEPDAAGWHRPDARRAAHSARRRADPLLEQAGSDHQGAAAFNQLTPYRNRHIAMRNGNSSVDS
jgi:hypothetical protein